METRSFLLPLLLLQLVLISDIAPQTRSRSLRMQNMLPITQRIYCLYESHIPPEPTFLSEQQQEDILLGLVLTSRQETILPMPQEGDNVACEFHVKVLTASNSFTPYNNNSALVFYEKGFGATDVKWILKDDGMYDWRGRKVFNWTKNRVGIWPTSLGLKEAHSEDSFDRLKRMLRRVRFLEKEACIVASELSVSWKLNCLHSSAMTRHEVGVGGVMRSGDRMQLYKIPAKSKAVSIPLGLWDEAVLCQTEYNITNEPGWFPPVHTYTKYILLYDESLKEPLLWSLKPEGVYLNTENRSKFGWYDSRVLGWPLSLWLTKPSYSVYQTLHRLLSNYMAHHRYELQEKRQHEGPLQGTSEREENLENQECKVGSELWIPSKLSCLHSSSMIGNGVTEQMGRKEKLVQEYEIPPETRAMSVPIGLRGESIACKIEVCDPHSGELHTKYVLLCHPQQHAVFWCLKTEGLFFMGEAQPKFKWNSTDCPGWPPSMWIPSPTYSVYQTLDLLLSNHLSRRQWKEQQQQQHP